VAVGPVSIVTVSRPDVRGKKVGAVGFYMGGRMAIAAASVFPWHA
jgi:dienelactone hydrolase